MKAQSTLRDDSVGRTRVTAQPTQTKTLEQKKTNEWTRKNGFTETNTRI